jgi:diguanylate cyclase
MNMEPSNTPIDIARQTLKQLAQQKIPPTPDNFRRVYDEISGTQSEDGAQALGKALVTVLQESGRSRPKHLAASRQITGAIEKRDWSGVEKQLRALFPAGGAASWSDVVRNLIRQLEASHKGLTPSKKKEGLERVLVNFESDPDQLAQKIQSLVASWGSGTQTAQASESASEVEVAAGAASAAPTTSAPMVTTSTATDAGPLALLWRELLIKTLELGLMSQLKYLPEIARQAKTLLDQAVACKTESDVAKLGEALRGFWFTLEMSSDAQYKVHEELMNLLRLLVDNMNELVVDDQWLAGQTAMIRDIISKPLNIEVLYDAESSLKELIYKQGQLKHGLAEAKGTLKQMAATFIRRLAEITESTGDYHQKIEGYQQQIGSTEDIAELNVILDNLMTDTRAMQLDALRSHEELKETQQKVAEAEMRIQDLTAELEHISEMAHEDYLTGALNRRGMDEALEREFSRADRLNTQLSIAMLDIDHFKKLNDTLGHDTGDVALAHLAKVTKGTLRPTDVLARYGGEEFIIILPETSQEEAVQVMTRVQRELTRQFFLHNNERVLITFSAGVAQRTSGEMPDSVMKRADMALYQAKQTGRNRVIGA